MPVDTRKAARRRIDSEQERLRARLEELEGTLQAIRSGGVDALVVETTGGDQIFTLKSADHTYRQMVEKMQNGAATLSQEGLVLYCNPFLAALLDVPREGLVGAPLAGFLEEPRDADSLVALLRGAQNGVSLGELSFRSGRRVVPTQVSLDRLPQQGSSVYCLIVTDLTERKRREEERAQLASEQAARATAEEAHRRAQEEIERRKQAEQLLRSAHERLMAVLASITDSYLVLDSGWRVLALNSAAERTLFERPAAEVIGKLFWNEAQGIDGEFHRQLKRALDEGRPRQFEARSEGTGRWFEVHAHPVDGRLEIYLRDISERMAGEDERARLLESEHRARTEAEAANRLKDEFLATLSHELRTPLSAIVSWSHMLREGNLDPAVASRAVEAIYRNARVQAQLVSDILDVSRIITGQFHLRSEPVRLAEVIEAAAETLRPAARAKDIRLELALDPAASPVSGEASRLQQVVWNLLSNAIKFAPIGGRIETRLHDAGACVEVSVIDDGPGIDPAFLPCIFDRFRQADSSSTREHAGLGLGLAIARHLVELHGGTIQARNREDGTGAAFVVRLPRQLGASMAAAPAEGAAAAPCAPEEPVTSLKDVSVLFVDDQQDAREAMAVGLERYGARVVAVSNAREALHALERERPQVLVADIGMSGEDGYALLRKVRALPPERGGATPAIALTAYASSQDRAAALRTGFQRHVPKPVTAAELASVVASVVTAPGGSTAS